MNSPASGITTRPLTVRAFQMLDTDGNGHLARGVRQPLANIVERLDRNDDGGLR